MPRPRIYHARKASNKSQALFAALHGWSELSQLRYERWGRIPDFKLAQKFAAVLGCTAGEVIHEYESALDALDAELAAAGVTQ